MTKFQLTSKEIEIHSRYLCIDPTRNSFPHRPHKYWKCNASLAFLFRKTSSYNKICTCLFRSILKQIYMQYRRMKFRCEDKRPAQLEDLNSTTESHRTVITSSGFVSTVHSINLYFFFSL